MTLQTTYSAISVSFYLLSVAPIFAPAWQFPFKYLTVFVSDLKVQ